MQLEIKYMYGYILILVNNFFLTSKWDPFFIPILNQNCKQISYQLKKLHPQSEPVYSLRPPVCGELCTTNLKSVTARQMTNLEAYFCH